LGYDITQQLQVKGHIPPFVDFPADAGDVVALFQNGEEYTVGIDRRSGDNRIDNSFIPNNLQRQPADCRLLDEHQV
jgi:hypothetical protein